MLAIQPHLLFDSSRLKQLNHIIQMSNLFDDRSGLQTIGSKLRRFLLRCESKPNQIIGYGWNMLG